MDLTAYASDRSYVSDPISVTVTQKLSSGDVSDAITDARRMSDRELRQAFGGTTLTAESMGFQVWHASLSNVTRINPGDTITYTHLIDGATTYRVKQVQLVKFEQQYVMECRPIVADT